MKKNIVLTVSVSLFAFQPVQAVVPAKELLPDRVTAADVAAALSSQPVEDATAVRNRLAERFMSAWVSDGKVPGKVLFADDFASGSFTENWIDSYAQKGMIKVHDDGRGGKCLFIPPRKGDFNCVGIKKEKFVPVDPTHPTAILWETRQPQGNTPFCEVQFFNEKKEDIRGEYQFRSDVDPTQPTIFQRNAHLVTTKMPSRTRFLKVIFHHCPKESDEFPGEIANVRVVDLDAEVTRLQEAEKPIRATRAEADARDVLVYCDDNISASYPVMPKSAAVPGRAGDTLKVRECPGEKTRATAVLWSKSAWEDVTVEFSDLKRGLFGWGGTIPASAMTAKIIKAHYQGEGAPAGYVAISDKQVLVPELFLNDDSLVIPDHAHARNLVKCTDEKGAYYVDINTLKSIPWGYRLPCSLMSIMDAKTLQPFRIAAEENKQLLITIRVPAGAKPGTYTGVIAFKQGDAAIAKLPVELDVLPFTLPAQAETIYDKNREYTMGLYVWAKPYGDGKTPYYSCMSRSREQCLNEWKALVDYGITDPAFIWNAGDIFNDARFRELLALAREAGFPGKTLHLGASGHIGNDTDPAKLAAKKQQLKHAMDVAREYGFDEVYFYGFDEAKGDRLISQIPAWKAAHEVGAKVMVSGYTQHFKLVGDVLDLIVYAEDPGSANPADWHAKGARMWKYNTPQAGPEDPNIFRRNYGMDIWRRGFDGANTYCEASSTCWNDVAGPQKLKREKKNGSAYRGLSMMNITTDGVIETTEMEGLESAIKDIRIMTKFRQVLRAHPDAAAQAWFDGIRGEVDDLVALRRAAIDWILKLQ